MIILFWTSLIILCYTYIGYGLVIGCLAKLRKTHALCDKTSHNASLPSVSVLIPAYNEADIIEKKIRNTLDVNYPKNKLSVWVISDGSTDETPDIVSRYDEIQLLHQDGRGGKIGAVNRAMSFITSDITISTDANTMVNEAAILNLVRHFQNPEVAAVSGEKRIRTQQKDQAAASGEGLYWRYESTLKRWDAAVNTLVGAAGELIAYRTKLFTPIPENTIIEDFYMTMKFCEKGFRVAYEPDAYAEEEPSASVKEELKRKIRICAGGIQAILALPGLLNVFQHRLLTLQYLSHRVFRWTLAPIALLTLLCSSLILASQGPLFMTAAVLQILFYTAAIAGFYLKRKKTKVRIMHVPFYFCMMNYAVYAGFARLIMGKQTAIWEKAMRR